MSAAARRAANPLLVACTDLAEASVEDLASLTPNERATLRGLCLRWDQMASYMDGQDIADHIADRHEAGLDIYSKPPGSN